MKISLLTNGSIFRGMKISLLTNGSIFRGMKISLLTNGSIFRGKKISRVTRALSINFAKKAKIRKIRENLVREFFVSICSQPDQDKISPYCDEKVHCIVKEIQFVRPDEFSCIVPCLGNFHTVKVLMKCIGKGLRGNGTESVLLEAAGYGSILTGIHYNRALE